MAKVEGLVCIGAAVFNHNQRTVLCYRNKSEMLLLLNVKKQVNPLRGLYGKIEEAFDYIEILDNFGNLCFQECAQVLRRIFRLFSADLEEGEDNYGQLSFKFGTGFL